MSQPRAEQQPRAVRPRGRAAAFKLGTLAALVAFSCHRAEYGGVEVTQRSTPPLDVRVSAHAIELPVGIAMLVEVTPYSRSSQPYTSNDEMRLSSDNPDVFQTYRTGRASRVVLAGARAGESCLSIWVEGERVDCLPVTVTQQEFDSDFEPFFSTATTGETAQ